jgi:16S rRNA (cytidine1402-2'-O)-methyltransferase
MNRIAKSDSTVVMFESAHRIRATLDDLERHVGGERRIALCRELTKVHEQTIRGTIPQVRSALADPVKGEITIVIEANPSDGRIEDLDLETLVAEWKREGLTTKEMAKRLQREFGWKRGSAYQAVLDALEPGGH